MNKTEMAAKLARKCDLSLTKAQEVINEIFACEPGHGIIAVELDADREITLPGFGKFSTKHRAARDGRNPATGETIRIAAKKYPKFTPGAALKRRVEQ